MSQVMAPLPMTGSAAQLTLPGQLGAWAGMLVYNGSGYDVTISGAALGTSYLPAGIYDWVPLSNSPSPIVFSPAQTVGTSPTTAILVTLYSVQEGRPAGNYPVYIGRVINIGNSVTDANRLIKAGDTYGLVTQDVTGLSQNYLNLMVDSISGSPPQNTGMALYALNLPGPGPGTSQVLALLLNKSLVEVALPLQLDRNVSTVGGVATAGSYGVSAVVAQATQTGITSTAAQTVVSYTPTVAGVYRANLWFRVNNGGASSITATVTYADAVAGGARSNAFTATGATSTVVANAAAIANGFIACLPLVVWATTGTNITITYRDGTNTPNDAAAAVLELLA